MTHHCEHTDSHARSPKQVAALLARVERRLQAEGVRWTEPRRRVLQLLLEAGAPVKAYDLMNAYGGKEGAAKPPTVYRALEFLEQAGLAHRLASLNAFIACDIDEQSHRAAFLICECCGSVREFDPVGSDGAKAAASAGFVVKSMVLEVRGACALCQ